MGPPEWDRVSTTTDDEDNHDQYIAHDRNEFPPSWANAKSRSSSPASWYKLGLTTWLAIAAGALVLISLAAWSHSPSTSPYPNARNSDIETYLGWSNDNTTEKTVVLYAYHETDLSRPNAEFFIRHALHDHADFIFIVNGDAKLQFPTHLPNVKVINRSNTCYDLGAHGEVLEANDRALVKKYDKFILMNASIRGPFMPHWSRECWTSAFTGMITPRVKLAGLTMNCIEGATDVEWLHIKVGDPSVLNLRHVQAMLLATDKVGLELLLVPAGLAACHNEYIDAIDTEIRLSSLIREGGYELDAVMSLFQESVDFAETCTSANPFDEYSGGLMHPHELLFVKSRAGTPDDVIEDYTRFAAGYDSRRYCNGR